MILEKRMFPLVTLNNLGPAFTISPEYSACRGNLKKKNKKPRNPQPYPMFWGLQFGNGGLGEVRVIDGNTIPIFPPECSLEKEGTSEGCVSFSRHTQSRLHILSFVIALGDLGKGTMFND